MSTPDKTFSLAECKKHNTDKSCWLVVHGKVYDVTEFLEEHPGGFDIILTSAGKDATQDFDEIGHSNSAKVLLEKYVIGKFEGGDKAPAGGKSESKATTSSSQVSPLSRAFGVLLPVLLLLLALAMNMFWGAKK